MSAVLGAWEAPPIDVDLADVGTPRRHRRSVTTALSILVLAIFVVVGTFGPLIAPHDALQTNLLTRLRSPDSTYWLGTDELGRDVFSRLIVGTRSTLVVVLLSLVFGAGVGVSLGIIAGYVRGIVDAVISRLIDALLAIPPIFFGLLFAVTIGPGVKSVVLALSLVLWTRFARVIRAEVVAIRERDFVAKARVNGCSGPSIILRHIAPNVVRTTLVLASIEMGEVILLAAILSFLGAGIAPPTPSWGGMISEGQDYISTAWWLSVVPGIAITLTVLAMNQLGDTVQRWLDPRTRSQA